MEAFGLRPAFSAVCVFGRDKRIVSASRDYARLLGYEIDDLVGASWERLSPPSELPKARRRVDTLLETGESYSDFRTLRRADGSLVDVLIQCTLLASASAEPRLIHAALMPVEAEYDGHFRPDSPLVCSQTIQDTGEELAIYAERHGLRAVAAHLRETADLIAQDLEAVLGNRLAGAVVPSSKGTDQAA